MTRFANLISVPELESTNAFAKELLADAKHNSIVVRTDFQVKGRGLAHNSWESPKGENLLISFGYKPQNLAAHNQFSITQRFSCALLACLEEQGIVCQIKWPNDLYYKNRKIAGMLVELAVSNMGVNQCVVGIGLNVNQLKFSGAVPNPCSMKQITGDHTDLEFLAQKLMHFCSVHASSDLGHIHEKYIQNLYQYKSTASYRDERTGEVFQGKITGIDPSGKLQVEHKNGHLLSFMLKEISYL